MRIVTFLAIVYLFPFFLAAQDAIVIDHNCDDLHGIPNNWINKAKTDLYIGYGHTSHGSQIPSGMAAIESYFGNGDYAFSKNGGSGTLHLFEGAGYGSGYLELDCGYDGWADQTREYLDATPECNVIIWSWCGQVASVNLEEHYLNPMAQLENEYPDVKFVYMTGHLAGQGPEGGVRKANDKIREFCETHGKILFDFAEIERFDPDAEVDYQLYNCRDNCQYQDPDDGSRNWAEDWMQANPDAELTKIAGHCSSCSHSVSLNCVKKGVAAWYLWSRLAGWDGLPTSVETDGSRKLELFPNPVERGSTINLKIEASHRTTVTIRDLLGRVAASYDIDSDESGIIEIRSPSVPGTYVAEIVRNGEIEVVKILVK